MDYNAFKEAVISKAKALGLAEYELYYEGKQSTDIGAFQHEINEFTSAAGGGVCFRAIVNGKVGYASTQALTKEEAAAIVERAAGNAAVLETEEAAFLCEGGKTYNKLEIPPYELPATDAMIKVLLDTQEKLYASDPKVVDGCSSEIFSEKTEIAICNSKGLDLQYQNKNLGFVINSVVSDGSEKVNDYQLEFGKLAATEADKLVAKATREACRKLGGGPAPTAVCPVIFSPEAMASLLSAFSPIFSSESTQKGLSRLGGKEGEEIASSTVTLVDDPFYPDSPMPMPFDAEGSPTKQKNVIENGRLSTLLYNMKTAHAAGRETTGNASKAGYAASIEIRPFTMYLAPGSLSEEELLRKAENGVYINSLSGLHAGTNAVSGDFSLQSAGFLIEGGKQTKAVKSFTVAGNFYDLLHQVSAIGSNLEVHSTGITAFGSPSVLVENLSIAGK